MRHTCYCQDTIKINPIGKINHYFRKKNLALSDKVRYNVLHYILKNGENNHA